MENKGGLPTFAGHESIYRSLKYRDQFSASFLLYKATLLVVSGTVWFSQPVFRLYSSTSISSELTPWSRAGRQERALRTGPAIWIGWEGAF